jgi:ribonuclease HI
MPFRRAPGRPSAPLFDSAASSDTVIANIDGGARGNPGPAGYGVCMRDAQGKMIAELSEYLGHQTNNFAEYSGLLAALDYALAHGHDSLRVISDSELMVKQMNGEYKVRSPELLKLYETARSKVRKLQNFEIRHALRAQNKDADRLANEAMDKGSGRQKSGGSPSVLEGIVENGVIEFTGDLPEGTRVLIKRK